MLKKSGFTLAEVLITLMLIGTIAALTIPDLYLKFEEAYFKTKLINTFSALTEATRMMKNDYGGRLNGVLGYDGRGKTGGVSADEEPCPTWELYNPSNSANPDDNIMEMYSRYLNWIKKYLGEDERRGIVKFKDKTGAYTWDYSDEAMLVLADGTTVVFNNWDVYAAEGTIRPINARKPYTRRYKQAIGEQFVLDLNGTKGPNVLGRDVHYFDITANMVTSWRPCKFDLDLSSTINLCKTDGETCGYLWLKGISVY